MRKTNLARLLARRVDGNFISNFEREIGPVLFQHACIMGLEGLVVEARRSTVPARPVTQLGKGKKPPSPAMLRAKDALS